MRTLSLAVAVATLLLSAYSASAFTIVSSGAGGFGAGLADPDDMVRQLALGGQGGGSASDWSAHTDGAGRRIDRGGSGLDGG